MQRLKSNRSAFLGFVVTGIVLWGSPGLALPAGGPIMVGCEKERGWQRLSRVTLNELNLVLQAGRFHQMQSHHGLATSVVGWFDPEHQPLSLAEALMPGQPSLGLPELFFARDLPGFGKSRLFIHGDYIVILKGTGCRLLNFVVTLIYAKFSPFCGKLLCFFFFALILQSLNCFLTLISCLYLNCITVNEDVLYTVLLSYIILAFILYP